MKGIWAALVALELTTTGCALNPRPVEPAGVERSASVILHGKALDLHLSAPLGGPTADALVLYASGDGGWFGAAVDMFHRIGGAGYYTVGFSAKAFLKIDRRPDTPMNAEQLAAEYVQILDTARRDLHLQPGTEVILTGWSRGAAFAVLAASAQGAPRGLRGVLAIGLSEGEDLEINGPADESDDGVATEAHDHWPFEPYALMALLPFRCAVIQATQDNFLVAARARTLFGSDTEKRRLYAVDARNHRFSGGKDAFDRALIDALGWITSSASSSSDADLVDASEAAWPLRRSHPSASNQEK
jgi:dienelactone hydrolase